MTTWFKARRVSALLVFFISLLIVILALWIVSLIQTQRYTHQRAQYTRTTPVDAGGIWVTFRYPRHLFLDGAAGELRINAWRNDTASVSSQPLTVTLRFPAGIQVASETISININDEVAILSLPLSKEPSAQIILQLTNGGTVLNPRDLTIQIVSNLDHIFVPLSIHIESPRSAAWRIFWTEVVSDKGPIAAVTTALLSVITIFLQYFQRQQEQQRLEARRLIQEVRNSLVKADCRGVERAWNAMQIQGVISTLSEDEVEPLRDLVDLALAPKGASLNDEIKKLVQTYEDSPWCNDLCGAFLCYSRVRSVDKDFKDLLLKLPVDKISDDELREKVVALWKKSRVEYQDRKPSLSYKDEEKKISEEKRDLQKTAIGTQLSEEPLLREKAEDEGATLFEKKGFWPKHSIYEGVMQKIKADGLKVHIIYGQPGCGRTALAKAVMDSLWADAKFFPLYHAAGTNTSSAKLKMEMVQNLLKYICDKPTLLVYASEIQIQSMAMVLCQKLGVREVLGVLDEAKNNYKAEGQNPVAWSSLAQSRLALLQQAVKDTDCKTDFNDMEFLEDMARCFRTFRFEGFYFVLDFTADDTLMPSIKDMVTWLPSWQRYKIGAILLIDQVSYKLLEDTLIAFAPQLLSWSAEDLQAMVSHRFEKLAKEPNVNRFLELENFCAECEPKTPRQAIRLWKRARLVAGNAGQIEQEHLRRAQEQLHST